MHTLDKLEAPALSPLRVLIVEDAPSTLRFLRAVLGCVAALEIVGEAGTGYEAVRLAHVLSPDLVLLDLSLPDADGADILPDILWALPVVRVVVLSGTADVAGPAMVARGATGFISKGLSPDDLVRQLSAVLGLSLSLPPAGGPGADGDSGPGAVGHTNANGPAPARGRRDQHNRHRADGPDDRANAPLSVPEDATLAVVLERLAEMGQAKASAETAAREAARVRSNTDGAVNTSGDPFAPLTLSVLSSPLRVLIVEDAPSTVRLLRAVLGCVASLDIVGDAGTGQAAVQSAGVLAPDLVLLDLSLPDVDGADILSDILGSVPGVRVVVLSGTADAAGPALVAQGATGFINKGLAPEDLVHQLSVVLGAALSLAPVGPQAAGGDGAAGVDVGADAGRHPSVAAVPDAALVVVLDSLAEVARAHEATVTELIARVQDAIGGLADPEAVNVALAQAKAEAARQVAHAEDRAVRARQPKTAVETSSWAAQARTGPRTDVDEAWGRANPVGDERALRAGIASDELFAYYQPIVDLQTGQAVGVEALARWHTRDGQVVLPHDFIGLAESTGLIGKLGQAVLAQAVAHVARWNANSPHQTPLFVSVNLSPRQLVGPDLAPLVAGILAQSRLDPSLLHLEITETAIMDNVDQSVVVLHDLRRLGLCLSIDDFGTGHSSLAYLQQLPVDMLKIDRCFVTGLTTAKEAFIVAAVLAMSRSLGLRCVAEGVETSAQHAVLVELGCQLGQGYLWSRPMSPSDAEAWAARRGQHGRHDGAAPGGP